MSTGFQRIRIQTGWVEVGADPSGQSHYVTLANCKGDTLCGHYGVSGLYAPLASSWSCNPCKECMEKLNEPEIPFSIPLDNYVA